MEMDNFDDDRRLCGCPVDYHLSDCPIITPPSEYDYEESPFDLPLHRTEAGYPRCATCDGGGCLDCTDPA